jgi:peptidyl-prolyl cis-trans isomerase SurA
LLLAALPALLLAGCDRTPSGSDVVAKVNGEKILRADMEKYFQNQTAGSPQQPAGEQASSLRLSILKQLIDEEILMQRARKLGLLATDEEVDAKLNEVKAGFTEEEFNNRLKERNYTLEDYKRDLRKNTTIEKLMNKEIGSKITITDSDITTYFNDHKTEFNLIEPMYHLAQIVVYTAPMPQVGNLKNDKAQNEAEATKKVQTLMGRLDSGEDFSSVAMNYSEQAATSASGGDMGLIPESALKQESGVMEKLSRLKAGDNTGPLPVYDAPRHLAGYRILKLVAKEPAGQRDLNDPRVQASIRQQLRERREQLLKNAYYEVIRNEAKVENYLAEELLKETGVSGK